MSILDRMKLAMKGSREQRQALIRDPNKMVSAAVLSSPKLDSEIETCAYGERERGRLADDRHEPHVDEELLRDIRAGA